MSPDEILTPAQIDLVRVIQAEHADLYLTGGAALSAFHLGHRYSKNLDLFTGDAGAFDAFPELTRAAASAVGVSLNGVVVDQDNYCLLPTAYCLI